MKLRLTFHDGSDATDIALTCDANARVSDVARYLSRSRRPGLGPEPGVTLVVRSGRSGERTVPASLVMSEAGVRSGDEIGLAVDAGRFGPVDELAPPVASLQVVSGPDAGRTFPLRAGSNVVGRERDCDVRLTDPLVSKHHARVNVTDVVEIIDTGSSNGVVVAGELVARAPLRAGDVAMLGETGIAVVVHHSAASRDDAYGAVAFNRSPRLDPPYIGVELVAPEPPQRPQRGRLPFIAMLAPLIIGAVLYAITRSITSILFVALSPLMMVGSVLENRVGGRRSFRSATRAFQDALVDLAVQMQRANEAERVQRRLEHPALDDVVAAIRQRTPLLWTRRPEHDAFLELRLGLGTLPSRNSVKLPTASGAAPELIGELRSVVERFDTVDRVPVVARLAGGTVVGLAGPESAMLPVARGLVLQLVGLHSPAEVVVAMVATTTTAKQWDWLKWLPHVGSEHSPIRASHLSATPSGGIALVAELEDLVDERAKGRDRDDAFIPVILLLVDDDAPIDRARLVELAERGRHVGVHVIWLSPSVERLPAACDTYLHLDPTGGAEVAYVADGHLIAVGDLGTVDQSEALSLAQALAPVIDSGARADGQSDLPQSISFLSLTGVELATSPDAVVERWRESGSLPSHSTNSSWRRRRPNGLRTVVGDTATDPFHLDLRAQGPHALVGGTTGSGKSEFLQSWILGMAVDHSPRRVTFLLVDYKGGAAFADCVHLPHTVGLVTDLSPHLVQRALTSLHAELRRREQILNRKKAKDLAELERRGDTEAPPSLVIVIDEFAALVAEVPEFVDGVVNVAQRGRSLGLHLVLATQRPAGVIKENLRANTNLRIALRMADEDDSTDVVGVNTAASFDPDIPGRAVAKTGPGRVTPFQASYVGGWTSDTPPPPKIVVEDLRFGTASPWELSDEEEEPHVSASGPNDISRVVGVVRAASHVAQLPVPRKPWLPELAPVYELANLPTARTDTELVFGVRDDPREQSQPIAAFLPDRDGNMAVFGTGGTGKSTVLRTLAIAAGLTARGGPCTVYGLDFAGRGLQMLEALPHVGAVIGADDHERTMRLLRQLRGVIDERAPRFARAEAATITEYRARSGNAQEPRVLVLLDGIGAFRQTYELGDRSRVFDLLVGIAGDGRQVGVHLVVTADQPSAIPSGLRSAIQQKLVLRMADANDYALLGAPADAFDAETPPGRGFLAGDEVQIAVLGGSPNLATQSAAVGRLALAIARAGGQPTPDIGRLPERIDLAELPVHANGRPVLGIADDDLQPIGFEPDGVFLVTGPPLSGRTSTVATLLLSLDRWRPGMRSIYLGTSRSPLVSLRPWDRLAFDPQEVSDVAVAEAQAMAGTPPGVDVVIVVEGLSEFLNTPADDAVQTLIKACRANGHFLIAESETSSISSSWGLFTAVKAARRGIVLQPDQMDGDTLFKLSLPRLNRSEFPVGRGFMVTGNRLHRVQVAQPVLGADGGSVDANGSGGVLPIHEPAH
jgi:S-DNA-T family DNA segregation ATPase FtsK/SpoIIIE